MLDVPIKYADAPLSFVHHLDVRCPDCNQDCIHLPTNGPEDAGKAFTHLQLCPACVSMLCYTVEQDKLPDISIEYRRQLVAEIGEYVQSAQEMQRLINNLPSQAQASSFAVRMNYLIVPPPPQPGDNLYPIKRRLTEAMEYVERYFTKLERRQEVAVTRLAEKHKHMAEKIRQSYEKSNKFKLSKGEHKRYELIKEWVGEEKDPLKVIRHIITATRVNGGWEIPSETKAGVFYTVSPNGQCSCPRYMNKHRCAHSRAMSLRSQLQYGNLPAKGDINGRQTTSTSRKR